MRLDFGCSKCCCSLYVAHPVQQGIVQSFSVFIDTIFYVCTAFIILLSGVYVPGAQGVHGIFINSKML